MPKIKAFLLVLDPSFSFYVHYPDLPFEKHIKSPEGNLEFFLLVPTSEDFGSEKESVGPIDFGQFMIKMAETGEVGECDLIVECPVLVTLEQEIDSQIIAEYKAHRDYVSEMFQRVRPEGGVQKIDVEKVGPGDTLPPLPTHHDDMFRICREYLKRFLLSLREGGNVHKLRFHDYNKPEDDFFSGLFGKYYFEFHLQDEGGTLLFDQHPLPSFMEGGGPRKKFMIMKPISHEKSLKGERLINRVIWDQVCGDLESDFEPDLAKTFLLDAQHEALSGNIGMAIVCAAIACEILTKRLISSEASKINNKLYDYIIDKVREISIVDLLHVPLKSLIGYSIREKHQSLWKDLEKLFQARNKVVHVGKCFYMSTNGRTKTAVDLNKTMHFIERAYELAEILGTHKS